MKAQFLKLKTDGRCFLNVPTPDHMRSTHYPIIGRWRGRGAGGAREPADPAPGSDFHLLTPHQSHAIADSPSCLMFSAPARSRRVITARCARLTVLWQLVSASDPGLPARRGPAASVRRVKTFALCFFSPFILGSAEPDQNTGLNSKRRRGEVYAGFEVLFAS